MVITHATRLDRAAGVVGLRLTRTYPSTRRPTAATHTVKTRWIPGNNDTTRWPISGLAAGDCTPARPRESGRRSR